MADFSVLKQSIQNYIRQNGNKEITGDILQTILLSMVTTMGEGAINNNASDIVDIKGDIQNINGDISDINGDITEINGAITNINGDITDLNGDLSDEVNRAKGAETTTVLFSDGKLVFKNAAGTVLYQLNVDSFLNAITTRLNTGALYAGYATPSTTPAALTSQEVLYLATQAGTYTNFHFNGGDDPIVLTKDGIYFIVSGTDDDDWNAEPMLQLDDVPTASSNNAVKSGGVAEELALGAVYDVSAKNPTAGLNNDGKWESLSALLSDANLNTLIPTAVRKGGMSIKFVSSVDNKYVQYMFKLSTFTAAQFALYSNWERINLEEKITDIESKVTVLTFDDSICYNVGPSQTKYAKLNEAGYSSLFIYVSEGEQFSIQGVGGVNVRLWATCSSDGTIVRRSAANLDARDNYQSVTINENEKILIVNAMSSYVHSTRNLSKVYDTINNTSKWVADIESDVNKKLDFIDGYIFGGFVSPNSQPTIVDIHANYWYLANTPGTYVNCGNVEVNKNEVAIIRRNVTNDAGTTANWYKSFVADTGKVKIVVAYDASDVWRGIVGANVAISINDGINAINAVIQNSVGGDVIILSDGTFGTDSNNYKVNLSKSLTIIGQGTSTLVRAQSDVADIAVNADGVTAKVYNVNVAHAVALARKTIISHFNSTLVQENIFVNGSRIDVNIPNTVFALHLPTFSVADSPYKYYATYLCNAANPMGTLAAVMNGTDFIPSSQNINDRTILILPGQYIGTGGVYFSATLPGKMMGIHGYEKETYIKRNQANLAYANDIYVNASQITDVEICVENISFHEMLNFSYASNFHMINCYRDGVLLDDYNASHTIAVGKNKICARLSQALFISGKLATTNNRYTIEVHGECRDYTICEGAYAGVDIEGFDSAHVMLIGINQIGADRRGTGCCVRFTDPWDGYVRNIDFSRIGTFNAISFGCIEILGTKGQFQNIRAYNKTFAGKYVEEDGQILMVRIDQEHRTVRCIADENSPTGYTAIVYSPVFGTQIGSYECTAADAAAEHYWYLQQRKPDTELSLSWEDQGGGRRYGLYISSTNLCQIELRDCIGYGSPWGFHNTRGIYVDYGSPRLFNCIGIGGGIGHRNHGIICHRDTEAELINCIGIASPFAYLTPSVYAGDKGAAVGIKFQCGSASKLSGCIGYGNDMEKGHGIHADMRTCPHLVNCQGYNGGGNDSAGLCITEFATMDVVGGYFGSHSQTNSVPFTMNNGNGMDYYPYYRPTRKDSTEDEVIYGDQWVKDSINTAQSYYIENITFSRGDIPATIGAGNYLKIYDVNDGDSSRILISSSLIENIRGNYQYVKFASPYLIASGHHIYICIEDSDGHELTTADGLINGVVYPAFQITENADNLSGVYVNQFWSHEEIIDPANPRANIIRNAIISGSLIRQQVALRIGQKASIGEKYDVCGCTIQGQVVDENGGQARTHNCTELL